jgi:tRNA wybutosine-synthesizing protein 4
MAAQSGTTNMAGPPSPESIPKPALTGIKLEKNAGLIMGTNNSSIVSKRSVERIYYPKPHFFQHFVRKPQRRSPTINRGYWLRMQAVDSVVKDFLQRPSTKQKVVINLGCG